MKYEIQGDSLPVLICKLEDGESLFTESGGMGWMTDNIDMSTNMEGGFLGGLARKFSGESLFMTTYTCNRGQGTIAFPSSFPGSIMPFELGSGDIIIAQKKAFLCAERSVNLEMHISKKVGVGFFGGEGFIMQKLTGPGLAFIEVDGSCIKHELLAGEKMIVDTGHVAAMTSGVNIEIKRVKGFKNMFFGGEGLFLTELNGPGTVWLQTMPVVNVARSIIPYLPLEKDKD